MKKLIKKKRVKPKPKQEKSRYRFNAAFAEGERARARKSYRAAKGKDFELTGSIVLGALSFYEDLAETLPVVNLITSETEHFPVLRLTKIAQLLDVSYQTLWRWTSETEQLPEPVLVDNTTGREYGVYHVEEVRVMLSVIGQHLCDFKYYRKNHEAVKKSLFDQFDALRALNYNQTQPSTGEEQHVHQNQRQASRKVVRKKGGRKARSRRRNR